MLTVENVGVRIGRKTILDNVSFDLFAGEIITVFGPSGEGKSTLLNVIAGFIRIGESHSNKPRVNWFSGADPDLIASGRVLVDGVDQGGLRPEDRSVSLVLQHGGVYPHMTARQNIGFPMRCEGKTSKEIRRKSEELAASVLFESSKLDQRVRKLSGGEAQRIAIAKMLAKTASIGLLDEPFSNLDQVRRLELSRLLRRVVDESDQKPDQLKATLMISHDWREAKAADKMLLLNARKDPKEKSARLFKIDRSLETMEEISRSMDQSPDDHEKAWIDGIGSALK